MFTSFSFQTYPRLQIWTSENPHTSLNYTQLHVHSFFWGKGPYSSLTIHDSTKVNNNCSPWPLSENQCQWMSVNLRPTLSFLPSTMKLQVFPPVIIVFVCFLRNSKKSVTDTSLAAQMNDICKWMSPEYYPLVSQLAGVSLWSFLCRAVWKFLLNSFLFSFLLDKKLLYILFSREHIILSKLHRKRSIFKMNIT